VRTGRARDTGPRPPAPRPRSPPAGVSSCRARPGWRHPRGRA